MESKSETYGTSCLERPLHKAFTRLGGIVGTSWYCVPFIVIPLILAAALGAGVTKLKHVSDVEYLYTPMNGPAKAERSMINENFPFNDSGQFSRLRQPSLDGTLSVIFESKTDNILTSDIIQDILDSDTFIKNIKVTVDGVNYVYQDICSNWRGQCLENGLLEIYQWKASMVDGTQLDYPQNGLYWLGDQLGGVKPETDNNTINVVVQSAKSIKLTYSVRHIASNDQKVSNQWLSESVQNLETLSTTKTDIRVISSNSIEEGLEASTNDVIPLFAITYTIVITFAITSCMIFRDWVTSKPWLSFMGVLAAGLAIVSAFGLMCYCQVEFASQVGTMPFLALGIGIDDMFVLISAWRRTNAWDSIQGRMRESMGEAGVSITITSITNALAFCIGAITDFMSIQIFCLYAGVSMLFCFLYSITFFAGFMAVFGKREEKTDCSYFLCKKCTPSDNEEYHSKSTCYKIWCTGGFNRLQHEDRHLTSRPATTSQTDGAAEVERAEHGNLHANFTTTERENNERKYMGTPHHAMNFFRDYYARFLMNNWTRIAACLLYLSYLGVALYGCTQLREGLKLGNLAPSGSYLERYYAADDEYFKRHGLFVHVVIRDDTLDYSTKKGQAQIMSYINAFESDEYFVKDRSISWLSRYNSFLNMTGTPRPSNMVQLVSFLQSNFFQIPGFDTFSLDVNINGSKISSSRFFVLSRGLPTSNDERYMMEGSREIASDLGLTVFHPGFIFYDQYQVVVSNTLQNMGIAIACMVVISLLLVPRAICSLYIGLSIVSIMTGVIGFMTLWNVNLDSISMINLILCIGFSVDYTAHITYSFAANKGSSRKEKATNALYDLGFPVLQGAVSTILGVVVLFASRSYIFQAFAKIIMMVIMFGAFHGLVILPVVLSVIGPN